MQVNDTSTAAQRQRAAEHLKEFGSLSTPQARRDLNIMMPAARIHELKREGMNIEKIMVREESENGHIHRFARYFFKNK